MDKRRSAERFSRAALTVTSASRGWRHPQTATRQRNLSVLKVKLGDLPGAATDMERALAIMLSLDMTQHPHAESCAYNLADYWRRSGQPDKAARLQAGEISDLLPVIEDPENRDFGPPSPFAKK